MLHLYLSFLEYLRKPRCRELTKREKNQRKYPTIPLLSSSPRPITSSELYAEDADNPPEELLYEVKEPPKRGRLAMRDDINRNVFRFTQVRREEQEMGLALEGKISNRDKKELDLLLLLLFEKRNALKKFESLQHLQG